MKDKWTKQNIYPKIWVLESEPFFKSFVVKTRHFINPKPYMAICALGGASREFLYLSDAKKWIIDEIKSHYKSLELELLK